MALTVATAAVRGWRRVLTKATKGWEPLPTVPGHLPKRSRSKRELGTPAKRDGLERVRRAEAAKRLQDVVLVEVTV